VTAVVINCEPVKPRVLQSGLFVPLAPEPAKLELTLARLAKLVGAENIGAAELLDTHRPDAFQMKRFVLKETKKGKAVKAKGKGQGGKGNPQTANSKQQIANSRQQTTNGKKPMLGFRMFRPALRALVQTQRGRPTEISAWDKTRSVYGKVVGVAGPWRTTGDWWRADMWVRDEWDVAIKSNVPTVQTLYRIYREARNGEWFVEGIYD
jgi:protein ImuB